MHTLLLSDEMNRLLYDNVESLFYMPTIFIGVLNRPEITCLSVCLSVSATVRHACVYLGGVKIVSAGQLIL